MTESRPTDPAPPRPEQRPHEVHAPAGTRSDPYYWLRDDDREDPDVLAHLEAENRYFAAMTADQERLRGTLYEEMVARIKQDDASPPAFDNGYWYYSRYEQGRDYPVHARRAGTMDAPEEILVDVNALAAGHAYYRLGALAVSPDNRWLAWSEDTVGRRQYRLRIRDLASGLPATPASTPNRHPSSASGVARQMEPSDVT